MFIKERKERVFCLKNFNMISWGGHNRIVKFAYLYRDTQKKPCAILMIFKRPDIDYTDYFCIPSANSSDEIKNRAKKDFLYKTDEWRTAGQNYTWDILQMISYQASEK